MPRYAVVLGTRPEIVKLAGILDGLGEEAMLIHTGQHYDSDLSQVFFDSLGLQPPEHNLELGSLSRAEMIGRGTVETAKIITTDRPAAVIVQGDTNSALAGALAANAVGVPLVHVEAGLRSHDRAMPEEHNRVVIDHLADLLAAPTSSAVANLTREGITGPSVVLTGNTVVEAVHAQLPDEAHRAAILEEHGLKPRGFVLATIHRPENTDDRETMATILDQLGVLPLPVVLPIHPRTMAAIHRWGLVDKLNCLQVLSPLDGHVFLALVAEAALVVSDSGGVQEEVTVLGRPLVVVRRSTERPEAFEHHATLTPPTGVADASLDYLADVAAVHLRLESLPSPFGDGTASARIVEEVRCRFG